MRRIGVISDVHANLEALEEVLERLEGTDVYCLGDLVDYGANPNEVIEAFRERGVVSVMGNHDWAAVTGDASLFNAKAAMSSMWTRKHLEGRNLEYLRGLPLELRLRSADAEHYFTHGSPDDRLWEYVDPRTHAALFGHYLSKVGTQSVALGHTHVPYVWKEGRKVVFNPGSVGQPRDGDWRASFAQVEFRSEEVRVEVRRIEYAVGRAGSKLWNAGLPVSHADRLLTGS